MKNILLIKIRTHYKCNYYRFKRNKNFTSSGKVCSLEIIQILLKIICYLGITTKYLLFAS